MLKNTFAVLVLLLLGTASATVAHTGPGDDNSFLPAEDCYNHSIAPYQSYGEDVFDFPDTADTWVLTYYPYWWNIDDQVFGTYVTTEGIDHADISLTLTTNSLTGGGHCDFEFQIDGEVVGTFTVTESSGLGPIEESFDFPLIFAGEHELCYYETNQVGGGLGSIVMNEAAGINSVSFTGPSALEQTTWGAIKTMI